MLHSFLTPKHEQYGILHLISPFTVNQTHSSAKKPACSISNQLAHTVCWEQWYFLLSEAQLSSYRCKWTRVWQNNRKRRLQRKPESYTEVSFAKMRFEERSVFFEQILKQDPGAWVKPSSQDNLTCPYFPIISILAQVTLEKNPNYPKTCHFRKLTHRSELFLK